MLACKGEREFTVGHERKLRTVLIVYRIKLFQLSCFVTDFLGQIRNEYRFHVNDPGTVTLEFYVGIHFSPFPYVDRLNHGIRYGPGQIDVKQPVFHDGFSHLNAFGEHKGPLKLTRGYSPVEKDAAFAVVALTTSDDQLPVFDSDGEFFLGKPGHGQGNAVGMIGILFDIERRIPFVPGLCGTFQKAFQLLESQQMRVRGKS